MIKGMSMTWEQAQAEIDLFRKIFEEELQALIKALTKLNSWFRSFDKDE